MTTPPQRSGGGASTHSVSSGTTPPDRLHFPRGTASRSTFHGGQLRERRTATYNGPPASPTLSHDAAPLAQSRARGSTNLFSKLTSKFTRRYVTARHHGRFTGQLTGGAVTTSTRPSSVFFFCYNQLCFLPPLLPSAFPSSFPAASMSPFCSCFLCPCCQRALRA